MTEEMQAAVVPTPTPRASQRGLVLVAISALAFGSLPIFFSLIGFASVGPGVQVINRLVIGFLSVLLWNTFARDRKADGVTFGAPQLAFLALNGFVLIAAFTTYNLAIGLGTSPAKAVLLVYVHPLYTVLLSRLILEEKLAAGKVWAILAGVAGIIIAMGFWQVSDLLTLRPSDLLALFNGLLSSLIVILGRKSHAVKGMPATVVLQFSLLAALVWAVGIGLVLQVAAPGLGLWELNLEPHSLLLLLATGVLGTAVPYLSLYSGLKFIQASISSLILLLEPVSVFVFQALILGQPVAVYQIVGGAILLIAGYVAQESWL